MTGAISIGTLFDCKTRACVFFHTPASDDPSMSSAPRFQPETPEVAPAIPLTYRLPNPPPLCAFDDIKQDLILSMLDTARCAHVFGPAKCGKRALVSAALARSGATDRVVFFDCSRHEETTPLDLLRVVAQLGDVELPWSTLANTPRLALEALIDLSDASALTIVCARCDALDPRIARALAATVSSYTRRAKWVFTWRPVDFMPGRTAGRVRLDHPSTTEKRSWISRVASELDAPTRAELAESSPTWGALADALDLAPDALTPVDSGEDGSSASEARALTELAHAMARGDHDRAADLIEVNERAWLDGGFARELFELLHDDPSRAFEALALRAATITLDPELLARCVKPLASDQVASALWARIELERVHLDAARQTARALDPGIERAMLMIHIQMSASEFDDAIASARGAAALEGAHQGWLASLITICLVWMNRADEARIYCDEFLGADDAGEGIERDWAAINFTRALHLLGRIDDARRLLESVDLSTYQTRWSFYHPDAIDYLGALISIDSNDPARAKSLLGKMLPWIGDDHGLGIHVRLLSGFAALELGDLEDAREHFEAITRNPHASDLALRAETVLARIAARERGWPDAPTLTQRPQSPLVASMYDTYNTERALRTGTEESIASDAPYCRALASALATGTFEPEPLERAMQRALESGAKRREYRARCELAMLRAVTGDIDAAATHWAIAARMTPDEDRSAELAALARLIKGATLSELIELARDPSRPELARIAAAILGEQTEDRLVARVATHIAARIDLRTGAPDESDSPTWWFDAAQMRVTTRDADVTLSARTKQAQVLVSLCEFGGAMTKAELIEHIWGIVDHHPLEDENRLRMAVFKLRAKLSQLDHAEPMIVTCEDGYAIGPSGRWLLDRFTGERDRSAV